MTLSRAIKLKTTELGFDLVGITSAEPIEEAHSEALKNWLKSGFHSDLDYLSRNLDKRLDPSLLLEGARSVIAVAINYRPHQVPPTDCRARIAHFALYEDYHLFIRGLLHQLAKSIDSVLPAGTRWKYKACIDSAPVAERALAMRAGLGVIGRNRMLIHPQLGCQFLLGELITTLPLKPDTPIKTDLCGGCDRCIKACPTGALAENGTFDARKCISYLTQYGRSNEGLSTAIGNRLFGCDECILACPYEKNAVLCSNRQFRFYPERLNPDPHLLIQYNNLQFKEHFGNSCIERIGLQRLRENAEICIKNSK